jgi:hypothetical protein
MNDNLTTNASNEAESPAFLVGAVRRSSDLDKVCEISDITTKGFYVYKGLLKAKN